MGDIQSRSETKFIQVCPVLLTGAVRQQLWYVLDWTGLDYSIPKPTVTPKKGSIRTGFKLSQVLSKKGSSS